MVHNILLGLLAAYMAGAFLISAFYMRYRRLTLGECAFWGLLALLLPIFGPFFVIAARPGPRKRSKRLRAVNQ